MHNIFDDSEEFIGKSIDLLVDECVLSLFLHCNSLNFPHFNVFTYLHNILIKLSTVSTTTTPAMESVSASASVNPSDRKSTANARMNLQHGSITAK